MFATHGYPKQIKSDNASYFKFIEFQTTLKSWGVTIKYVTEYWPQANGLLERFNKVLLKHVQTLLVEGKDWRKILPTLLRNYLATPHGQTPSQLLMQRELRTKLPCQELSTASEEDLQIRQTDRKSKKKGKEYADARRRAKEKNVQAGDFVIVQQKHRNKFSTTFDQDPVKVIKVNCSQIVFEDNYGKTHCRNSAHVKKINYPNGRSQLTKKLRRVQVRQMQRVVQDQQRHQTKHLKPSNSRNPSNPFRHEDQTESENHQTITKRITKEH